MCKYLCIYHVYLCIVNGDYRSWKVSKKPKTNNAFLIRFPQGSSMCSCNWNEGSIWNHIFVVSICYTGYSTESVRIPSLVLRRIMGRILVGIHHHDNCRVSFFKKNVFPVLFSNLFDDKQIMECIKSVNFLVWKFCWSA